MTAYYESKKFNVNPNQVAVMGDSAGGYLTAFTAVTNGSKNFNIGENLDQSSEIVAAVDLYGIVDISQVNGFPQMLQSLNGVSVEATNPINYVTTARQAQRLRITKFANCLIRPGVATSPLHCYFFSWLSLFILVQVHSTTKTVRSPNQKSFSLLKDTFLLKQKSNC